MGSYRPLQTPVKTHNNYQLNDNRRSHFLLPMTFFWDGTDPVEGRFLIDEVLQLKQIQLFGTGVIVSTDITPDFQSKEIEVQRVHRKIQQFSLGNIKDFRQNRGKSQK